ncbi:hypothetical protein HO133_007536 [Letharia lupina]|uniref:Uncharacterized protein n=1 Tax=Letharia lupina TaxID=560253 RepID=A0A8H6FIY8_9LECA|nr:uncharacterized protein HO133_007536 [Letharia lupina]KAF6229420.1 hypothetical protein HO133_007536 [Letharia lupina]
MSDRLKVFSSQQVPQPSTSEAAKSDSERSSLDEAVYGCACGTPDASVNWICCDNDDCPVDQRRGTGESVFAAQRAVNVADGRRTKARATQPMERPTRSRTLGGTSKQAAKGKKGARKESKEEKPDEEDRTQTAVPKNQHEYLEPVPRLPKRTPTNAVGASIPPPDVSAEATNPTTPALSAQATHSPPSGLPDPSEDSTFAITVRRPSEVPSVPPASGAAMVIDTEEQGWTPLVTSVAPDGGSSVDYWSYRTNTWCTIPLSAIRSTLPRLL